MTFIKISFILILSLTAHANSFEGQVCRNADNSIIYKTTDIWSSLVAKKVVDGLPTFVDIDLKKHSVSLTDRIFLGTENQAEFLKTTSSVRIEITKSNSSEFDANFLNLSQDGLSLKTIYICEKTQRL